MHSIGNATEQDLKKRKRRNYSYKNSETGARTPAMKTMHTSEHQYGSLTAVSINPPFHTHDLISIQEPSPNNKEQPRRTLLALQSTMLK